MKRRNVVDLHYRRTWPRGFRDFVTANSSEFDGDHGLEPSQERRAVEMLGSHLIRAYHCTRLTDREVASVCESGLQPLSRELAMQRLTDAVSDGYLTPQQAAFYAEKADPDDPGRNGMVWLFTDRHSLSDAHQVGYLLENWGGEGINMDVRPHTPEMDLLEQIGTPTVVIANIDLVLHCDHAHPGILHAAVQQQLGRNAGTTIKSTMAVGADHISSIEQPGSPFWKRYVWTPRIGYRHLPLSEP